jgi:two-component system, NtrC family, nitrogen regulation sensor histidine kinase NtrY
VDPSNPDSPKDHETLVRMAAYGEMSREIMHEINTPLSTMSLQVDKIRRAAAKTPIDTQAITDSADGLSNNLSRIKVLRETIKERYETATAKPKFRTNLNKSVKDALALCRETLTAKKITVRLTISNEFYVFCKPVDLSEVWVNLIHNSSDAISARTKRWIQIEAKPSADDKNVLITFTDSGTELTEEAKRKMLKEEFTTKSTGTGLGLNIAKKILETAGGKIELVLNSEQTQFLISLQQG